MSVTLLQNDNVSVVTFGDHLQWYDLKDKYNGFTGYTQTKDARKIAKVSAFIEQVAKDERLAHDLTMGNVTDIMERAKCKPHTYCSVD